MQVYKAYLKILKQLYPLILVYTGIFFVIALLATGNSTSTNNINFESIKPKIAVINHDDSILANTFINYLDKNTKIIDIEDEEEKVRDALFYRQVNYVIEIPTNFSEYFIETQNNKLNILKVPNSTTSIYIESLIDKFFNSARLYAVSGVDEVTLSNSIINDLNKEVKVEIKDISAIKTTNANYYFNFCNYVYLALLILIISLITQIFNQIDLKRRHLSSPIKLEMINFQLITGHISVTFIVWLIFIIGSIILIGKSMFTLTGLLLILNSLIFIIVAANIAFIVGNLVKNSEIQSAIANVISLGSSFICGAFVPQMFLGEKVLMFARFFPSYWFIRANDIIAPAQKLTASNWNTIITCMLIQLGFAIIIYLLNLITTRYRRQVV